MHDHNNFRGRTSQILRFYSHMQSFLHKIFPIYAINVIFQKSFSTKSSLALLVCEIFSLRKFPANSIRWDMDIKPFVGYGNNNQWDLGDINFIHDNFIIFVLEIFHARLYVHHNIFSIIL